MRSTLAHLLLLALGALAAAPALGREPFTTVPRPEVDIDPRTFEVLKRDSGPINYYSFVEDREGGYLHADYKPGYKTTVLAYALPENHRRDVARVRWRWRAEALPAGGNECQSGKTDSAAVVYLTWKRGLRWYALKYVWSSVGPRGAVCDQKRNPFVAQDTVILESGGPLNEWRTVDLDPDEEFRKHFAGGDPRANVPDFGGIGIMSDGDQTGSESSADYGGFEITYR